MKRPLADWLRLRWEPILWGGTLLLGLWLIWRGYAGLAPLSFVLGLLLTLAGVALLRQALRRLRLGREAPAEGAVLIDEARIGYFGPREGGFIDLPAITSVEIVTRPHVPPASSHAWILTADDGTRLMIPLGAQGAEHLYDALSPLPGIDFDAGLAAVESPGAHRALVWRRAV